MSKKEPKIVFWDLETLPNLVEVMKVFPGISNYPGLSLRASINSIICFGYKELGDKKAKCLSAWDFPKSWKKNVNDDYELVKAAYDVLKDADGIVTHNGKRFDLKVLNTRLVYHGLAPLHKIPHIDTKCVTKSHLSVFNNRLNTIAEHFGCEQKLENGGWALWEKVLNRDKAACKLMAKYCAQDVEVLEQVFMKLRPFINNIPNYNLFSDDDYARVCPSCGGHHLQKHGKRRTKTKEYQRYLCMDCGSVSTTNMKDELPRSL